MARSKQFIDNLCWRLKALGAPKVHLVCFWPSFQSGCWLSIMGFRKKTHVLLNLLQVLVFATLLLLWTDIPSERWQERLHFTSIKCSLNVCGNSQCPIIIYIPWFWQESTTKFRFVELFAGQAECTKMFRYADLPSARLDLLYMNSNDKSQNPMDLLSDVGMVILGNDLT